MTQILVLLPAIALFAFMVAMLGVYRALVVRGRAPDLGSFKMNPILGRFWAGYIVWLLRPVERALLARKTSPMTITALSLVACILAAIALAFGHLAIGCWAYVAGGLLDLLDGRIARKQGVASKAGALFDSVADRWAELALFTGFAWLLRGEGAWLLAVFAALGGSMMVSYTRARAEGLGLELSSGSMQRAERIVLVSAGTLAAAFLSASEATEAYVVPVLGVTLAACGALSIATAVMRWVDAQRALEPTRHRVARSPRITLVEHRREVS